MIMTDAGAKRTAVEMAEGAGARVRRVFPTHGSESVDPFVLLDEFFVGPDAGFPEHPHKGFEAMTYMLDGGFRHKDSLGNDSEVQTGGVQRFSAGKGIVHSEMPGDADLNHGLQLWINLPPEDKNAEPDYQQVDSKDIPVRKTDSVEIRTIVGAGSPVRHHTDMFYHDIRLNRPTTHSIQVPGGFRGLVYVYSGELTIADQTVGSGEAYVLKDDAPADAVSKKPVGFVVLAGKPHGQPIRIRGSFVE